MQKTGACHSTEVTTYPPVKQNLFQVETMPPRKFRLWPGDSVSVMTRLPSFVVTAAGSYHSKFPVPQ